MQKMKSKERISQEFVSKLEGVEVNYLTLFHCSTYATSVSSCVLTIPFMGTSS